MTVPALIVEDGTIVTAANTYAAVTDLQTYASSNGVTTLPALASLPVLLLSAMNYIESKINQFQGIPTTARQQQLQCYNGTSTPITPQALAWPRAGVYIDGFQLHWNIIPPRLVKAQCQLACDIAAGIVLMPTVAGTGNLKLDKTGPITLEYFAPNQVLTTSGNPMLIAADALLAPLYSNFRSGALKLGRA